MNKLFTKIAALALGATMAVGVGVAVGTNNQVPESVQAADSTIIIDGSQLTSTATTGNTDKTYSGYTIRFSDGAKQTASSGSNRFPDTSTAILIGKSGKNIHNITELPDNVTKFEVYANQGASTNVTIGINFSSSAISSYDSSAANTYTGKLGTVNQVYDCSSKLASNTKYFWFQVTNAYNAQVAFRITYTSSGPTKLDTPAPSYDDNDNKVVWGDVSHASSYQIKVGSGNYETATSPYDGSFVAGNSYTVSVKAIGDGTNYTDSDAGSTSFTAVAPFVGKEFSLVNSTSDLVVGASYIITSDTSGTVKTMKTESNSNNRKTTEVTVNNSSIISTRSTLTVTLGGNSEDGWTFHTDNYLGTNGYLASASGDNNYLRVISDLTTGTIGFNGDAALINLGPNTTKSLVSYNSTNDLFACYNGGQGAVYLWKESNYVPTPSITLSTSSLAVGVGLSSTFTVTSANLTDNFTITGQTGAMTLNYTPSKNDTQTVTVTGNSATSGPVTLTVSSGTASETIDVSVKSIYTIAQARYALDHSGDVTSVFAKGIVSSVSAYDTSYHNITFNLSDDGTATDQLEVFRCSSSSDPDVKVGDIVTVFGNLTIYNETYEFAQGNTIKKHSKITGLVKSGAVKTTYITGDHFDPTNLVVTASYSDESDVAFSYASHESNFGFNPSTSDTLSTSNTSVSITYGHGSTTLPITVELAPAVLSVSVSPTSKTIQFEESFSITATVTVEGGASNAVSWTIDESSTLVSITSSTTSSATITANASVAGTAVVRATSTVDPTKSATCTIKVVDPDALTDTLTYSLIGVTGTGYSAWSGKTDVTSAVYAGVTAGGNSSIQMNSGYGVRNTAAPGYVRQVTITFNSHSSSDRSVDLYGFTTAQESITTSGGTSLGSATYDGTNATVTINVASVNEFEYFVLTASKAIYLDEIVITYEKINTDPAIEIIGDTTLVGKEGSSDSTSTSVKVKNIASPSFSYTFDEGGQTGKVSSSYVRISEGTPTDNVYPLTIHFDNAGSTKIHINVSGQTASIDVTVVEVSYLTATLPAQYRLVTDVSSLQAGDKIVIADNHTDDTKDRVMNGTLNSGYFGVTNVTFTGSGILNNNISDGLVLTLGGTSDAWTLQKENGDYLTANSSSNFVVGETSGTWTISISDGNASISYSTYGRILHNVNSGRFKPYTSAPNVSKRIPQIYKYVSGSKNVEIDSDLLTAISSAKSVFSCNAQGTSFDGTAFNSMSQYFTEVIKGKYYLDYADANENGNVAQQFLAMYDYAVGKYGADYDFLGRIASGKVTPSGERVNPINAVISGDSTNVVAIVVIVSVVGLSAIGGYFFLRKRREEN